MTSIIKAMKIPLFYDANKLNMRLGGTASLIWWDHRRCPNLVIIGKSDVGKSVCAQLMLGRVCRYAYGVTGAQATICDFKSEYAYLKGCSGHYDHDSCMEGLSVFLLRCFFAFPALPVLRLESGLSPLWGKPSSGLVCSCACCFAYFQPWTRWFRSLYPAQNLGCFFTLPGM